MRRTPKGVLRHTDVDAEEPVLSAWTNAALRESRQTIRNVGRIDQLEAGQTDIKKVLIQILNSIGSSRSTTRLPFSTFTSSWQTVVDTGDTLFEFDDEVNVWERARLALEPIGSVSEELPSPFQDDLSKTAKLLADLDQDFDDIGRRIARCTFLEEELSRLEVSLEDEEAECLCWCVSLVRDVLDYNYPEDLNTNHLALLQKAVNVMHEKGLGCTKQDYQDLHKEFLQEGLALVPTTKKAIDKYGD